MGDEVPHPGRETVRSPDDSWRQNAIPGESPKNASDKTERDPEDDHRVRVGEGESHDVH